MGRLIGRAKGRGRSPQRDRHGVVLVVVLLVMSCLVMLGSTLLTVSYTEDQIARNGSQSTQALQVAEGAVNNAIYELNQGLTPSTTGTLGPGEFSATVTDAAPPTYQKRVDATGYVPSQANPRGVRRVTVLVQSSGPYFKWGAFGKGFLSMSGGASHTDSYDSALGAYGGSNVGSNGKAGSNGNITLFFGAEIRGDATAGGTINDASKVTGTATAGASPVTLTNVDCPAGGYTASVPAGAGISYNPSTGVLTVSGGNNITLPVPPTSYSFSQITLSGGSTLTVDPGGQHVDIYVSQGLNASGGSVANTTSKPTDLSILGCGADTSNWTVSGGGTQAYFGLYAPNHATTLTGGGNIYGSVVAASILDWGGTTVHYDVAFGRPSAASGKYAVVGRTWTELTP